MNKSKYLFLIVIMLMMIITLSIYFFVDAEIKYNFDITGVIIYSIIMSLYLMGISIFKLLKVNYSDFWENSFLEKLLRKFTDFPVIGSKVILSPLQEIMVVGKVVAIQEQTLTVDFGVCQKRIDKQMVLKTKDGYSPGDIVLKEALFGGEV